MSRSPSRTGSPDDAPRGGVRPDDGRRATPWRRVFLAVLAGGAAMVAARVALGAVTLPETAFEGVARLLGVPAVFNAVHALPFGLDRFAKPALFVVVGVAWIVASAWLARRLGPWSARIGRLPVVVGVALGAVALAGLVILPAQGLGWFGGSPANLAWEPWRLHLAAAATAAVYAWIATGRARVGVAADREGRRRAASLLVRGGVAVAALAAAGGRTLVAWAQAVATPFAHVLGLSPRITPTSEHYVVSKNLFDPNVNADGWRLRIDGLVDRPLELTLDDLRALPSVTRPSTLICVSNPVGGDLIGTSEWTGVRLSDLLDLASPLGEAREVVLRGADNYVDSFPLDAATREGTIVAYLQNGEPLGQRHGYPARVLVPGIYGMKNVKWVERIELARDDVQGYWQTRGWSDEAIVKTMSRIDSDVAVRLDDGRVAIGGVAFAGLRGVPTVEVSLDGGATWSAAEVEPAPNDLSWVRWAALVATDADAFDVRVRAIDGEGTVQTEVPARPLPDGAAGHHAVSVRVQG